ncbi:MAG: hypothetical protein RI988_3583 [Pseudomonadota bacterium]
MSTPQRKTLFLGFEGVLHHRNAKVSDFLARMPLLERTLGSRDVDIVALSSWGFDNDSSRLATAFPASLRARVRGATKAESGPVHGPYREIQAWLRNHPSPSWRVLDCDASGYPHDCPELVLCSPAVGLSNPQAATLASWLEGG